MIEIPIRDVCMQAVDLYILLLRADESHGSNNYSYKNSQRDGRSKGLRFLSIITTRELCGSHKFHRMLNDAQVLQEKVHLAPRVKRCWIYCWR